ncbi:hypothetical protein T4C_4091 [Trichinella pseudospiralis]|uniref:Uncharacterized protein n=1 Tax=Trichinella pseudospiralis TaxID=6337 RepID=A0A0V1JVR6_TRIPS|nr:hypothetical protein T4C_4091 [Trichinella pseudospiralis]
MTHQFIQRKSLQLHIDKQLHVVLSLSSYFRLKIPQKNGSMGWIFNQNTLFQCVFQFIKGSSKDGDQSKLIPLFRRSSGRFPKVNMICNRFYMSKNKLAEFN